MAKNSPTLDFVIVRADLGDPAVTIPNDRLVSSITAIDELKHDARTRDMRILVLIAETMEGKVQAIREFFETKYNDQIAGYIDGADRHGELDGAREGGRRGRRAEPRS